ncbi:MAG: alpha/beta fold hydrolase [Spirochaetaceae bacterium]|nr:alpha/beta fold hydrolase [Spirochaetaceae bacterium]
MNHLSGFFPDFGGSRLHYQYWEDSSRGYDKIAILLHGIGCHSGSYPELTAALVAGRMKVFALDFAGFGASLGERGSGGARAMADAVEVFLRRIESAEGSRDCAIVAHSMGAVASLLFLKRYPARKVRLVLVAPLLFGTPAIVLPGDLNEGEPTASKIAADRLAAQDFPAALRADIDSAAGDLLADPSFLAERQVATLVGESDPFVPVDALRGAAGTWPVKRGGFVSYPRARHDLVGGESGSLVISDILAWLGEGDG